MESNGALPYAGGRLTPRAWQIPDLARSASCIRAKLARVSSSNELKSSRCEIQWKRLLFVHLNRPALKHDQHFCRRQDQRESMLPPPRPSPASGGGRFPLYPSRWTGKLL